MIPAFRVSRLIAVGWWLFAALLCYELVVHWCLLIATEPIEYREGAMLHLTQQRLLGINIYDFARQPYDLNVYGPLYNDLMAFASPLFGAGFFPHRLMSALFIATGCGVMVGAIRTGRHGLAIGVIAAAVWYAQMIRLWGVGARPDAMAILFYLLSIFVPWRAGFSKRSIAISALCSILAFLTKPYLAVGFVYVVAYMLLRRQFRNAFAAAAIFTCVFIVMMWQAMSIGDAYIYDTVFVNMGYAGSWNWPHFLGQALRFFAVNLPLMLGIAYTIAVRRFSGEAPAGEFAQDAVSTRKDLQFPLFAGLLAFIVLLRVAHNAGSGEYFVHLLSPIFLLVGYRYLAIHCRTSVALLVGLLQMAILAPRFPHFHEQEWKAVGNTVAKESNVLHSPSTTRFAILRGETVFDSGQTEFFPGGLKQGGSRYPQSIQAWQIFQNDLQARIARREFSLLLLNSNRTAIIDRDLIRPYYELCSTLPAPMYRNLENVLELWRPACTSR